MTSPCDIYAVVGNPIAHSKSPEIHRAFAQQTGQDMVYEKILAPLDGFEACVRDFFSGGGKGLNVTVPFKTRAYDMAGQLSPRAQSAGAVNTLWQQQGQLYGDNTDGAGLVRDLTHNLGLSLRGKKILILGAGGAVRGVLLPLLEQQPQSITIANRTLEKAQALLSVVPSHGVTQVEARTLQDLPSGNDVIIQATSAGLQGSAPEVPGRCYGPNTWAYDMLYAATPTPFLRAARQHTEHCADGLGMLVEQAAEAFYLWRGVRPHTDPVIAQLRQQMRAQT
jgi:shikimate dehydrogenase